MQQIFDTNPEDGTTRHRFLSREGEDGSRTILFRSPGAEATAALLSRDAVPDAFDPLAELMAALDAGGSEGPLAGVFAVNETFEIVCEDIKRVSILILPASEANANAVAALADDPGDRWDQVLGYYDAASPYLALFDSCAALTAEETVALFEQIGPLPAVASGIISSGLEHFLHFFRLDDFDPDSFEFSFAPPPRIPLAEAKNVALLYEAGLNRDGSIDPEGLNFWIGKRAEGLSETELARFFLESPEFEEVVGDPDTLSNRDLVRKLYENILNRVTDGPGEDFWTQALDDGFGRDELLAAFAGSQENRDASPFVETLTEYLPGVYDFPPSGYLEYTDEWLAAN